MVLKFEEFRKIKDSLPHGSMKRIAEKLGIEEDTVRNYFGGTHYNEGEGKSAGVHIEKGPNGGIVKIEDDTILRCALEILEEEKKKSLIN